jgi:hypothetical protein
MTMSNPSAKAAEVVAIIRAKATGRRMLGIPVAWPQFRPTIAPKG